MAQTPVRKLRRMRPNSLFDMTFAYDLRVANAKYFFTEEPPLWPDHVSWYAHRCKDPNFDFYLIWTGGVRVGTIAVEHRPECEFLQNLCIKEEFRGYGIARWAITQLMLPGRFIIAQVKPSNKHVIKMYQDLGFWRVRP